MFYVYYSLLCVFEHLLQILLSCEFQRMNFLVVLSTGFLIVYPNQRQSLFPNSWFILIGWVFSISSLVSLLYHFSLFCTDSFSVVLAIFHVFDQYSITNQMLELKTPSLVLYLMSFNFHKSPSTMKAPFTFCILSFIILNLIPICFLFFYIDT